jgi:hypothetical protein
LGINPNDITQNSLNTKLYEMNEKIIQQNIEIDLQKLNEATLSSCDSVTFALCSLCRNFAGYYCILDFHWSKKECPYQAKRPTTPDLLCPNCHGTGKDTMLIGGFGTCARCGGHGGK